MADAPAVGQPAPDFTLDGIVEGARRSFTLSAERGRAVVLAFYPGDDTPVCTKQLCAYSDDFALLTGTGAAVWGISAQSVESHASFATRRNLKMPLLADPAKSVSGLYGGGGLRGSRRSVFVIDADGIVRWSHLSSLGLTYKGSAELRTVLDGLPATRT